ncbi:TPA: DUF1372 family protein [Streptococcus suis]|uniref:DUF1372 family protein n=1 Tax=Streptococcus suis TaxID=1307 RepID=UPI001479216D|nr:DUF1372 family protein [Streptococcus suis]MDY7596724.1 DUF1372 family protein [Streptococcus suis]HEL1580979.1 DUF1372 family protein [Streptococcus suis]HEL1642969.1 DUF1372 family protein [Streptococcus suis]HEL1658479.1 DUF1372 family protein [Streptococcus suis]HEL1673694.1 DUF1372 family protein [Streptococcus suis]
MKEAIKFVMVMLVLTFAISMSAIYKLKKQVEQLESRQPIIIYQVDNAGTEMFGEVTAKDVIDGHYYVEIKPYGKFLVTREQYEEIEIGQEMPEYLKGRKQ